MHAGQLHKHFTDQRIASIPASNKSRWLRVFNVGCRSGLNSSSVNILAPKDLLQISSEYRKQWHGHLELLDSSAVWGTSWLGMVVLLNPASYRVRDRVLIIGSPWCIFARHETSTIAFQPQRKASRVQTMNQEIRLPTRVSKACNRCRSQKKRVSRSISARNHQFD